MLVRVVPAQRLVYRLVVRKDELHLILDLEARRLCRFVNDHRLVELCPEMLDLLLLVLDHLGHIVSLRLNQLLKHVEGRPDGTPGHRHRHHCRDRRRVGLLSARGFPTASRERSGATA